MKTNKKPEDRRVDTGSRLAGGGGAFAAKQDAEGLLRRAVMACLLWEGNFYEDGIANADNIKDLIPQVAPATVAAIAVEARAKQKLRHVPLFIAREAARIPTHRPVVGDLLPQIILRADEIAEFMALYWKDGKQPLAKQVKLGLAKAFNRFDAYQLAKYNRDMQVRLRDVLFLVHPRPPQGKEKLYQQLADDKLPIPDTWEVALSAGSDKKATWERLIQERKLGALAFLRNLRNMEGSKVDPAIIRQGFKTIKPQWLLPLNCLAAATATPYWAREIETLLLAGLAQAQKLPGHTVLIVDVSGSMNRSISGKSAFTRLGVGAVLAMLAAEMCESVAIYATAGYDHAHNHATALVPPRRGFALIDEIKKAQGSLGGGGIFTRQCLEYIRTQERETPARIIVFSDSQDCDLPDKKTPRPFGQRNYIIDVSAHQRGINYAGAWTAEIAGWSEHFLSYIAATEGLQVETEE